MALCLEDRRYQVEVTWSDSAGNSSGLFAFFGEQLEIHVDVIDGCGFNGHFWVFAAASTHVAYTMTVTDTVTGAVRTYENPLGRRAAAITDTEAFATCPGAAP